MLDGLKKIYAGSSRGGLGPLARWQPGVPLLYDCRQYHLASAAVRVSSGKVSAIYEIDPHSAFHGRARAASDRIAGCSPWQP
jgi:hypothetical protein